jgi:sarcosine oxidase, subunit beta
MPSRETYDVIVIGAGSVGTPTAMFLSEKKLKVLVIEKAPAVSQGQNKRAIGGVRATHSDAAKIALCLRSREVFAGWKDRYGDDIGWKQGGYCYPVYREADEKTLKEILPVQKKLKLKIDWVGKEDIMELVPGINPAGLRGGTWSPDDGQASPMVSAVTWQRHAEKHGAAFRFNEEVTGIGVDKGRVASVKTDKGEYHTRNVVNAAGADAREVGSLTKLDIPVFPDCHEAGISAPVEQFLRPLVVDMRPGADGKSANFYFGQNDHGQIIFCYTPQPPIVGKSIDSTSEFLPTLARRLVDLIPRFKNLMIRRVWRGLYPMTPDGVPILDKVREFEGMYLACGMCGQGFMMGPGVGVNMASLIADGHPEMDERLFKEFNFYGDFYKGTGNEKLK